MLLRISAFGILVRCGFVLAFLCWTTTILSAAVGALSNTQSTAIRGAADRDDTGAMYALIFSAISQQPERTADIVAEAMELVPERRDAILATVGTAFPAVASQFTEPAPTPPEAAVAAPASMPTPIPVPDPAEVTAIDPPPVADLGDAAIETAEAAADDASQAEQVPLWSGEGELGAAHNTGNTKNDSLRLGAQLVWAPGNWENRLKASYNLLNDSGTTTERRFVTSARPLYNITDRFFGLGYVRYVDDKNDGFQWILTEAVAPGYRLLNSDDLKLDVAAGPGMQQTREKQDDGGNLNNEVVGVGFMNFEWIITENTKFTNNFGITSGAERTRLDNVTALTLKVFGDLAARLSYEVRHDTAPGDDAKKTDTTGLASIVYSFEAN